MTANLLRAEGVIASVVDDRWFSVLLLDGQSRRARISRRLGYLKARLTVGDRVLIGMLAPASHDALIITGTKPATTRLRAPQIDNG